MTNTSQLFHEETTGYSFNGYTNYYFFHKTHLARKHLESTIVLIQTQVKI